MEKRIGFGRRLGAYVIDMVFIMGIGFIFANLFTEFFENFVDWSAITDEKYEQTQQLFGNFTDLMFIIGVAGSIASFLYNILEGFMGYTVGKLMLGIQIGNQDGTPSAQGKLMTRFAIKNISTIFALIGMATLITVFNSIGTGLSFVIIIGCFFALGEKKLALHDLIAKTAVYRKSELADGSAQKETPFS